jgi:hypothetical protein
VSVRFTAFTARPSGAEPAKVAEGQNARPVIGGRDGVPTMCHAGSVWGCELVPAGLTPVEWSPETGRVVVAHP